MTELLDWDVNADAKDIRGSAIELRSLVAKNVYLPALNTPAAAKSFLNAPRTIWRLRCIEKAEVFLGHQLAGTVVEIGAGTGWCSAVLSKRESIQRVYALDYDPVSVNELMPRAFTAFEANEEKITRVLGSYNEMKLDNGSVDCVVSIGALHHSENLLSSLSESYRVLRPGGILIASEPCYPNSMSIGEQLQRENEIVDQSKAKKLYGKDSSEIKAIDNSDHFYRLAEYEGTANKVGFDAFPFVFDSTATSGGKLALAWRYLTSRMKGDELFSSRNVYDGFNKVVSYPYFAKKAGGKVIYDDLLLLLQKPEA